MKGILRDRLRRRKNKRPAGGIIPQVSLSSFIRFRVFGLRATGFIFHSTRFFLSSSLFFFLESFSYGMNFFILIPLYFLCVFIHDNISSYFALPDATARPSSATSSLVASIFMPLSSRNESIIYIPIRLFPSTKA